MNNQDIYKDFLRHIEVERLLSPNTVKSYTLALEEFFNNSKITDTEKISKKHLVDYRLFLQDLNVSNKTKNLRISAIRTFINFCIEEKEMDIEVNMRSIKTFSVKQIEKKLTLPKIEIFEKVLSVVEPSRPTDIETFINLGYTTGLRLSEMLSLKISEVQTTFSVVGKGAKERLVVCPERVVELVREREREREMAGYKVGLLFPYSASHYQNRLRDIGKQEGFTFSPHILRHMYASTLVSNGANLMDVQFLLGHSSIITTQIYAKIFDKRLVDTHKNVFK